MRPIKVYSSKTVFNSLKKVIHSRTEVSLGMLSCLLVLMSPSCQKEEFDNFQISGMEIKSFSNLSLNGSATYYYRPGAFVVDLTQTLLEERDLYNQDFVYFENFKIHVQNGISSKTTVSKIEIRLDGILILTTADFNKEENIVSKAIPGLTAKSLLDVYIAGVEGGFIELCIEGTVKVGMEGVVTDVDGNYYHTVTIGSQVWMAENLRTTKFNDGTSIPLIVDKTQWAGLSTPAFCWYNNNESDYKVSYGALYNWNAVNIESICPSGWHVPDDAEWTTLANFVGGMSVAGEKLKEAGTIHWLLDKSVGTDENGFTGLPGGFRLMDNFSSAGSLGLWWSSSESSSGGLPYSPEESGRHLEMNNSYDYALLGNVLKVNGLSVRCLKD